MKLQMKCAPVLALLGLLGMTGVPAQDASVPAPQGNGTPPRIPGSESPAAIPGYTPSTDPHDLRGVWRNQPLPGSVPFQLAPDIQLSAMGAAEAKRRVDQLLDQKGTTLATPHVMCRPAGVVDAVTPIAPIYVLQSDKEVVFIVTDEMRSVLHAYLDQRHPQHLTPSYEGDSVAHWEGNTLVIDTVGFNGRGELGIFGPGHHTLDGAVYSKRMHLIQRITKSPDGTALSIESWFDDSKILAHPASTRKKWVWVYGQQPLEYDCEENPREDNFAGMVFADKYLSPVCIQYEGKGDQPSKVICDSHRR